MCENTVLESVIKGIAENSDDYYNAALEDAKSAVVNEFLRLKDLGRNGHFDIADITTPIERLKRS